MALRPTRLALLVGLLALVALASVAIGAKDIPIADVWHALTAPTSRRTTVCIR